MTFWSYNDATRAINGAVTIQLDNITLTPVPEPSTTALVCLLLGGLLFRRIRGQC